MSDYKYHYGCYQDDADVSISLSHEGCICLDNIETCYFSDGSPASWTQDEAAIHLDSTQLREMAIAMLQVAQELDNIKSSS